MTTGLIEYFGDSVSGYDRRHFLVSTEREVLAGLFSGTNRKRNEGRALKELESLQRPLWTFAGCATLRRNQATQFVRTICRSIFEHQSTYWSWDSATWATVATKHHSLTQDMAIFAYIACSTDVFDLVYSDRIWSRNVVASRIFGSDSIERSLREVADGLRAAGYRESGARVRLRTIMASAFLHERHADLRRLGSNTVEYLRGNPAIRKHPTLRRASVSFAYALAQLGIIDSPPADLFSPDRPNKDYDMTSNVPDKWLQVARRWKATSTLSPGTRSTIYGLLLRIGRWIGHEHPDKADPADWTRTTVAEFVAMVDRMRTGDHLERVPVNLTRRSRNQKGRFVGRVG